MVQAGRVGLVACAFIALGVRMDSARAGPGQLAAQAAPTRVLDRGRLRELLPPEAYVLRANQAAADTIAIAPDHPAASDTAVASADTIAVRPGEMLLTKLHRSVDEGDTTVAAQPFHEDVRSVGAPADSVREYFALPIRYVGYEASGERQVFLRPEIEVAADLALAGNRYQGALLIALADSLNPLASDSIAPVRLAVIPRNGTAEPDTLTIQHTNLPFTRVQIEVSNPPDPYVVRLRPSAAANAALASVYEVRMGVLEPRGLDLEASPDVVQGWGLEGATLVISLSPEARSSGHVVRLDSQRGTLRPVSVRVDEDGLGSATLKSRSIGPDTVQARVGPYRASAVVRYAWPLVFFVCVLIGAFIGGVGNYVLNRSLPFWIYIVGGLIGGLIASGLFTLGVNVFGVSLPSESNEIAYFVWGMLGGFGGVWALDRFLGGKSS